MLTHLACADEREAAMTSEQLGRFEALARDLPFARSLANSAAVFAFPGAHGDWVRPGLALYGVSPFAGTHGASLGLVPAMRLLSTVISLRDVPAGQTVGYGGAWRAARDSRIAIVAAGYGDGLPWSLSRGATVLVNGKLLPLAGRVSMDMIAVDVTGSAGAHRGRGAAVGPRAAGGSPGPRGGHDSVGTAVCGQPAGATARDLIRFGNPRLLSGGRVHL